MHSNPFSQDAVKNVLNNNILQHVAATELSYEIWNIDKEDDPYTFMAKRLVYSSYNGPVQRRIQKNLEMAKELGYKTVFWSLAYVDWKNDDQPDPDASLAKLLKRTHNGAVVLLHSTSQTNAKILDTLLTRWEEAGYTFGTLDDLFPGSGGANQ